MRVAAELGSAGVRARAEAALPLAAIALGCLALATRPLAWRSAATLVLVGAIGLLGPVVIREQCAPHAARWLGAVALGAGAFAGARALDVPIGQPVVLAAAGMNVLAAIAEEAFFRRFVFGWFARWGAGVAVAVSTVLFALVHVPHYGVAVLPIDLAAGALFGWQRWATGSWTAAAVTHAVANLLQMG